MNTKVKTATAEDHEVEGLRATADAHAKRLEVLRTRRQCAVMEGFARRTSTGAFEKPSCKGLGAASARISAAPETWQHRKSLMNCSSSSKILSPKPALKNSATHNSSL